MADQDLTHQLCLATVEQALSAVPKVRRSSQWLTFFWPMTRMEPQSAIVLMVFVAVGPGVLLGFLTGLNVVFCVFITAIPLAALWGTYAFTHYDNTDPSEQAAQELLSHLDQVNKRLGDLKTLGVDCEFLHFHSVDQIQADLSALKRQLLEVSGDS